MGTTTNVNANKVRGLNAATARAEALSAGTAKHFPNASDQLSFDGGKHAVSEIQSNLSQVETLRTATTEAQASAQAKVAAERTALPPLLLFMSAYVAFLKAMFGNSPDVLADFGLAPRKAKRPLTTEQQAVAKAKRDATRKARNTQGPVAKLATVGNVIGVIQTPVIAQAVPVPAPAAATASTPVQGGNAPAPGASGSTPRS